MGYSAVVDLEAVQRALGISGPAQGDLMVQGATDWDLLNPGASPQVLTAPGAGDRREAA